MTVQGDPGQSSDWRLWLAVFILAGVLLEAMANAHYFHDYFAGPLELNVVQLFNSEPKAVCGRRVVVRWHLAAPAGIVEERVTSDSYTSQEIRRETTAAYRELKLGRKLMLVKTDPAYRGNIFDGLVAAMTPDLQRLADTGRGAEEHPSVLPFYIDTQHFTLSKTIFGLGILVLFGGGSLKFIRSRLPRARRSPTTSVAAARGGEPPTEPIQGAPTAPVSWRTRLDASLLEWEVMHWQWLLTNLQANVDLHHLRLVAPTPDDFPVTGTGAEEKVQAVFRSVQQYFGVEQWPCRLEPFGVSRSSAYPGATPNTRQEIVPGVAGLFAVTPARQVVISYNRQQAADPMALVATLAHELSHYVLATIQTEPPGGWEVGEQLADLTAVFFGFGIFLANASFRFSQWQDSRYHGWSARNQGYLSENALALALALFCRWKALPAAAARPYLAPNPRHHFKVYYRELGRKHAAALDALKALS